MKKMNWTIRLGIFLIIFCIPFFLFIAIMPFLEMEAKIKITLSTISLIIGEILFWSGGILVGKELLENTNLTSTLKTGSKKEMKVRSHDDTPEIFVRDSG